MENEQVENQQLEQNPVPVVKKDHIALVIWGVIYPPILYLLFAFMVQIPAQVIFLTIAMKETQNDIIKSMDMALGWTLEYGVLLLLISALLGTPIYLGLMWRDKKKQVLRHGKKEYQKPSMGNWMFVVILAITFCISLNGIISLSGIQKLFPGFEEVAEAIYGGSIFIQILGVGIVGPIVEEFLFRGLAYKRIENHSNWKVALIVSSLFFGLYHMNVVQFMYASILGFVLAYLYYKFHTILAPILFHVVANTTSILLVNITVVNQWWESKTFEIIITIVTGVIGMGVFFLCTKIKLPETKIHTTVE